MKVFILRSSWLQDTKSLTHTHTYMRTHRAIQTLNHQEESLAQTPVWFSKWHLRCVWREADGCLRLLRRRREREWRGVVEGVEWRKETGRDRGEWRGEWRVVSQEEVGGTFFLPSLHGQMQLCDCFNTYACVHMWAGTGNRWQFII